MRREMAATSALLGVLARWIRYEPSGKQDLAKVQQPALGKGRDVYE